MSQRTHSICVLWVLNICVHFSLTSLFLHLFWRSLFISLWQVTFHFFCTSLFIFFLQVSVRDSLPGLFTNEQSHLLERQKKISRQVTFHCLLHISFFIYFTGLISCCSIRSLCEWAKPHVTRTKESSFDPPVLLSSGKKSSFDLPVLLSSGKLEWAKPPVARTKKSSLDSFPKKSSLDTFPTALDQPKLTRSIYVLQKFFNRSQFVSRLQVSFSKSPVRNTNKRPKRVLFTLSTLLQIVSKGIHSISVLRTWNECV